MGLFDKLKKKTENNKRDVPTECRIKLFGETFEIKILNEIDKDTHISIELTKDMLQLLWEKNEEIQECIRKYVLDNYRSILENYYLCLSYPSTKSDEYNQFLLLRNDYENDKKDNIDIVLKNIKPIYYSITEDNQSYLFLYMNDSDGYGIDVILLPHLSVQIHD